MRKLAVLFVVGLMVMAFGVTANAQPKVTMDITGFIDFAGIITKNITDGRYPIYGLLSDINQPGGNLDKTGAFANSRARLKFTANAGKELKGVIFFEMDSDRWGDYNGTRNSMGYWNADRAALEVKHAYFAVGLPYFGVPVPITMTFGVQTIDVRSDFLMGVDGAGIKMNFKADPVNIDFWWAKPNEGRIYDSDDNDIYALHANGAIGDSTLGGYWVFENAKSYPPVEVEINTPGGGTATYPGVPEDIGANAGARAKFNWVGAYWDGKFGGVGLSADLIYDWGEVKPGWDNSAIPDIRKVKYNGYFATARATYDWEMFMFGGGAWYASGSDVDKTGPNGLPGEVTANGSFSNKVGAFVVPGGDGPGWPFGYPLVYFGGPFARANNTFATDSGNITNAGGVGGTWGAYAYGGYKLAPWYNVWLQAMYLGDTTKNGNTNGNARQNPGVPADTNLRDDKTIGIEFALTNQITVYDNLELYWGAGYLFAGDAFDIYDEADGDNKSPDNPWDLATRLVFSF